jgi:predicted TIM-barrel fold metal-dependent hydrolase
VSFSDFVASIPAVDAHSHAAHVVAPQSAGDSGERPPDQPGLIGTLDGHRSVMNFAEACDLYSVLPMDEVLGIQADRRRLAPHAARLHGYLGWRRHTAMERELGQAYRDLYGADPNDEADIAARYAEAAAGGLRQMLGQALDRAGIERAIVMNRVPAGLAGDARYLFNPNIDPFAVPKDNSRYKAEGANEVEIFDYVYAPVFRRAVERHGYTGGNLGAYLDFLQAVMADFVEQGAIGFKVTFAYVRPLRFAPVAREEAARLFVTPDADLSDAGYAALQDFLMRFLLAEAVKHDKPVQFHAALGGPPAGLRLADADPANLENIFLDHHLKQLKVVILHTGFPRHEHAGYFASMYANVFLDTSYMQLYSPTIFTRILREWLEHVPANKVLFGTDGWSPETYYAAAQITHRALGGILEDWMAAGWLNTRSAEALATQILRDNTRALYRLP